MNLTAKIAECQAADWLDDHAEANQHLGAELKVASADAVVFPEPVVTKWHPLNRTLIVIGSALLAWAGVILATEGVSLLVN